MTPTSIVTDLITADVMSPDPVSVTETESVAAAWELLTRGSFHHLPVVRGRRCVGMLDSRVLVQAWQPGGPSRSQRRVGELLSPGFATVSATTAVSVIAELLWGRGVDAAVVVDEDARLLGVVTASDLLRVVVNHTR